MKKISILGCGWIGKALKELLENDYTVYCLSKDIDENIRSNFYDVDTLVIAIPPRDNYIEVLQKTFSLVSNTTQVILLSSISFYKSKDLVVEAEELVKTKFSTSVILRLGGLMGYDRVAGKYSAGKILQENLPTNYVHRDDVIHIIKLLIDKNIQKECFDVVAPKQSNLKEIYELNSQNYGFEKTIFESSEVKGKSFSPKKLIEQLEYKFIKDDVKEFWSK